MSYGPAMVQATVGKVYFTSAEPRRRAVVVILKPKNRPPVSVPIPEQVSEGDRIMIRRDSADAYQFIRTL